MSSILLFLSLFASGIAYDQLREFEITSSSPSGPIPVFRDHSDKVAVIIRSSLTNLTFDSNLGITANRSEPARGEYILILDPVRQSITVNAPGYQQGRIQITLTEPRQVAYYRVEPKPEVATNVIPTNFQITPADAIVLMDGTRVDASKPVLIEIGTHALKIEKQGYRTIEKEVRISPDQNFIRETLSAIEPVPLTIRTQPAGAIILVDGIQVGVTDRSGALGMFRFPGEYQLSVQLSGSVPQSQSIIVTEDGPNAFGATLERNAGTLELQVTPADAVVLLNREPRTLTGPIELAPGMVRIEVSKEGHEPFSETVEIVRGQATTRAIALVAHLGGIQITTAPLEAIWSLTDASGKVVANGTGLARKTGIPVGIYTLTVKASGHQDHVETIRIERDRVIERSSALREGPMCGTTITDIDGNSYKTVQIGEQCWMAENLKTSKYQDGTPIPNVTNNSQWMNLTTGAWAHYNNQTVNETNYGKLYNWYAVADRRNVCPVGWHVPTDEEWEILSNQLGSEAGHKMKSTSGWNDNDNGSNYSGFNGLPGGNRNYDYDNFVLGGFFYVGRTGYFWSSTDNDSGFPWIRYLDWGPHGFLRDQENKRVGLSVRCLRD